MKKVAMWLVAIITSLISMVAMCIFDYILSVIYRFIGKVPFLSNVVGYVGDILDLGLTVIVALVVAISVWKVGHSTVGRLNGGSMEYNKSPICHVNSLFIIVFVAMVIFLGYEFVISIGEAVKNYTADFQGFDKFLMFCKSIKDTYVYICNENIILYKLGVNSFVLSVINEYAHKYI